MNSYFVSDHRGNVISLTRYIKKQEICINTSSKTAALIFKCTVYPGMSNSTALQTLAST